MLFRSECFLFVLDFSFERLQLSAEPVNALTIAVNDNATGFGKLELCLAELEGLREWLDTRFRETDLQPDALRLFNELREHVFRINVWRNEYRIVVHVMPGAFQMKLTFQKIINRGRKRNHLHLTDLNAERQSLAAGFKKTVGKIPNVGMQ